MAKVYSVALVLCSIIILISVVEGLDKNPKSVKEWLRKFPMRREKVSEIRFFLHETNRGNKSTAYPIIKPNITSTTSFGEVIMIDDILRVGAEPDSKIIGRAQGLTTYSSLVETSMMMILNFVFTSGKYNGSSLAIQGSFPFSDVYREFGIVGGSGVFRLASGILTTQTRGFTDTGVIGEFNAVAIHYV